MVAVSQLALAMLISFVPGARHPRLSVLVHQRVWRRAADLAPLTMNLSGRDVMAKMLKQSLTVFRRKAFSSLYKFVQFGTHGMPTFQGQSIQ
jgi:hypothetical protein